MKADIRFETPISTILFHNLRCIDLEHGLLKYDDAPRTQSLKYLINNKYILWVCTLIALNVDYVQLVFCEFLNLI